MTQPKVHSAADPRYGESVPIGRSHDRRQPVPYLEDKAHFEGMWVATAAGKVIAAAPTSRDLVWKMREIGPAAEDAVVEFVRPATDGYIVGVG